MIWILLAFIAGLIVGWNVAPQPVWVKRQYDRAMAKASKWIGVLLIIAAMAGCDTVVGPSKPDIGYAKERAMAEIAIAAATADKGPAPIVTPKVGDKCPQCNNPPGACGVGRTGDGSASGCNPCLVCGADGRIDERDLKAAHDYTESKELQRQALEALEPQQSIAIEVAPVPDPEPNAEPIRVQKEILLHSTFATAPGWPSQWYAKDREQFEKAGWIVRHVREPESVTKVSYFDVVAPDGEVFQFYQPITLSAEDAEKNNKVNIRHLETR